MVTTIILPLALAFIMFSLGLGLRVADFTRVITRPKDFTVGAACQLFLLPVVAFLLVLWVPMAPEIKVGVMLLSFVPGGVTSNMLTKFARGDVALSISLTALISLLFLVTLPLLIPAAVSFFQSAELASQLSITKTVIQTFLITAVPVALGLLVSELLTNFATRARSICTMIASFLFAVIVIGLVAMNWDLFITNVTRLGPVLIALNILMLALAWVIARWAGMEAKSATTVAVEAGVQNATLAIAIAAGLWANLGDGTSPEFSAYALPAAVYGILMYFVSAPFILWRSRANLNA